MPPPVTFVYQDAALAIVDTAAGDAVMQGPGAPEATWLDARWTAEAAC